MHTAAIEATFTRKTMVLTWRSRAGRVHKRRVDLGHVRDDADLSSLALLNVYRSGSVVSYTVEPAAA